MTPIDTLRAAAERLRGAANAATPGPWIKDDFSDTIDTVRQDRNGYAVAEYCSVADSTYIALMHPSVALAVADWLDFEANVVEVSLKYPSPLASGKSPSPSGYSLAVALTVLGGDT